MKFLVLSLLSSSSSPASVILSFSFLHSRVASLPLFPPTWLLTEWTHCDHPSQSISLISLSHSNRSPFCLFLFGLSPLFISGHLSVPTASPFLFCLLPSFSLFFTLPLLSANRPTDRQTTTKRFFCVSDGDLSSRPRGLRLIASLECSLSCLHKRPSRTVGRGGIRLSL